MIESKNWLNTNSGRKFWPLTPDPDDICIEDIAHHLSMLCRYTGATDEFYCVAQHSVMVSELCRPTDALWGLLHDAAEAYINDLNRPVKHTPELQGFRTIEKAIMLAVCEKFSLPPDQPRSVTEADHYIIGIERDCLFSHPNESWTRRPRHEAIIIDPWSPGRAERAFLARYQELRA